MKILRSFITSPPQIKINRFIIGLILFSVMAWMLNHLSPEQGKTIQFMTIVVIISTVTTILSACINNTRHVSILAIGLSIFLLLRFFLLFDVLYYVLLCIFLISLNIAMKKYQSSQ